MELDGSLEPFIDSIPPGSEADLRNLLAFKLLFTPNLGDVGPQCPRRLFY